MTAQVSHAALAVIRTVAGDPRWPPNGVGGAVWLLPPVVADAPAVLVFPCGWFCCAGIVFLAAEVDDRDAAVVPAPFGSGSAGPGDLPGCGHGGHLHQGPGGADRGDQPGLVLVVVVGDKVVSLEKK